MPDAADLPASPREPAVEPRRGHLLFRAPSPLASVGLIGVASAALAAIFFLPDLLQSTEAFVVVFAAPAILAGVLTTPLTAVLGGRLRWHRSLFLALSILVLEIPIALVWRGALALSPSSVPGIEYLGVFLVGPALWFRHMSLYGVSRASHRRMLPVSLLQPVLYLVGLFVLAPPTPRLVVAAGTFLLLGFVCSVALLRASDRPIHREFQSSGVRLIRPLLDHVNERDPAATRALEQFFLRSAIPANLKVSLLAFVRGGRIHATLALPTVHPGPFAALGASDLPRKLSEQLGAAAGVVLVPHTPSDHDLDLPSESEVDRIGEASRALLAALPADGGSRASPLVTPYPGSFARAQMLGPVVLLVVTQAPSPTDDIAYSVADRIVREVAADGGPPVALIDAHNSYVEGQGDISYGTPSSEKLIADCRAAVRAARSAARDGPVEIGIAVRSGYSIGRDGIGPQGLRALAVRAAGTTTGYVLIDGNNLLIGARDPIVRSLESIVEVAEVMTTDNHVVHEVDGGINPVGERHPVSALIAETREVLGAAVADLGPAEVRFGCADVPEVRVMGPGYTARLLTSLGDTLSMFAQMFVATLLILLAGSLVVAYILR